MDIYIHTNFILMCLFIYIYSDSITYNLNHNHNLHIFILIITINCSIIIVMWNLNPSGCLYSFWAHSHIYAFQAVSVRDICPWINLFYGVFSRCMCYAVCSAFVFWKESGLNDMAEAPLCFHINDLNIEE